MKPDGNWWILPKRSSTWHRSDFRRSFRCRETFKHGITAASPHHPVRKGAKLMLKRLISTLAGSHIPRSKEWANDRKVGDSLRPNKFASLAPTASLTPNQFASLTPNKFASLTPPLLFGVRFTQEVHSCDPFRLSLLHTGSTQVRPLRVSLLHTGSTLVPPL